MKNAQIYTAIFVQYFFAKTIDIALIANAMVVLLDVAVNLTALIKHRRRNQ